MPITAISFDAGFTLLEPTRAVAEVYHDFATRMGTAIEKRTFARHVAASWTRLNAEFRSADPELRTSEETERVQWRAFTAEVAAPFPELAARHEDWHRALVEHFDRPDSWQLVPDARETLEGLSGRGFVLAVVSNWHRALHGILGGLELDRHFELVLTSADAGRKKPHPEIWLEACRRLGIAPDRTLHVGDSMVEDFEGARGAGLEALLLDRDGLAPVAERIATLPEILRRV